MQFKILLIVLLSILYIDLFGQQKENFSIGTDVNYYYYNLGENTNNSFNYGFSLLGSYIINKYKISSGLNFSTQDSYYNVTPNASTNFLKRRNYNLQYINFPFLISYDIYTLRKYKTNLLGGVVFNRVFKYDIASFYSNKDPIIEKDIEIDKKTGVSLRLGFGFARYLNKHLLVTISPSADLKIEADQVEYRPNYHNLQYSRLSFGLKLGLEYLLHE